MLRTKLFQNMNILIRTRDIMKNHHRFSTSTPMAGISQEDYYAEKLKLEIKRNNSLHEVADLCAILRYGIIGGGLVSLILMFFH